MFGIKPLFLIFGFFKINWAALKKCSEKHDQLDICYKDTEDYHSSLSSLNVSTIVVMREIIDIDEENNSISVQLLFITKWKDARLTLSNESAV